MLTNSPQRYGIIARLLHWSVAITIVGLFALGLWMVELTYYDDWYTLAPHYHNSIGILLGLVMLFRVSWRCYTIQPQMPETLSNKEKQAAHGLHLFLYAVIFIIIITGYLIPTADNRSIDVFNWFSLPGLGSLFEHQEDIAGNVHFWSAWGLILLAALHALAALKHHFIDKDNTLKKML